MSTVLRPVGPRPARVYWVRRLSVLAVLVLVGAVIWAIAVGGRGGAAGATGDGAGSGDGGAAQEAAGADGGAAHEAAEGGGDAGTTDAGDGAAAPGTPTACAPDALTVTLSSDARTYPVGTSPVLTVRVTNVGATACTVDMAPAGREVLVTSGADRIWSSLDCAEESAEQLQLLEPEARAEAQVAWGRTRSEAGCTPGLPEPRPGTYTAVVTTFGATSEPAVFDLA